MRAEIPFGQREFFLKSSRPSFLIKRAALGNLKASFHCTHWHRFFPLKKEIFRKPTRPYLPLKKGVLKSSRPSLPLKKAPPFSPSLSSIVFTTPSVPLVGDRNPSRKGKDVTALRCSEPLRFMVGGPKRSAPGCAGWDRRGKGGDRRI